MMNKHVRELVKVLRVDGVAVNRIAINKHVRLYFDTPQGERFYSTSQTPSDWRAVRKIRADIRRMRAG